MFGGLCKLKLHECICLFYFPGCLPDHCFNAQGIDKITDEHIQMHSLGRPSQQHADSAHQEQPVEHGGTLENSNQPDHQITSKLQDLAVAATPALQQASLGSQSDLAQHGPAQLDSAQQQLHADHSQHPARVDNVESSSSQAQTAASHIQPDSSSCELPDSQGQHQPDSTSGAAQHSELNSRTCEGCSAVSGSSLTGTDKPTQGNGQHLPAARLCPPKSQSAVQPRRLPVPAISIAGWDDSPALVRHPLSLSADATFI